MPQSNISRIISNERTPSQHLHTLMQKSEQKYSANLIKTFKIAGIDPKQKTAFHAVFEKLQDLINAHVDAISKNDKAVPTKTITLNVDQEISNLERIFSFLNDDSPEKPYDAIPKLFKTFMFKFCNELIAIANLDLKKLANSQSAIGNFASSQEAIIDRVKRQIAQVVFLADRLPEETAKTIDFTNIPGTLVSLESSVKSVMEHYLILLHQEWSNHNKTGLQDPDLVQSIHKPLLMANILLTESCQLNLGMVSYLKDYLLPKERPLLEYEIGMQRVLDQIDYSWQKEIDSIVKPESSDLPSNVLIRADLGLARDQELTDRHAKLEVLGAMLSQLCQGPVGDCFAIAWEIKKHNEYLHKALKDYSDIAKYGYLTRNVNGHEAKFFFECTIADDDLTRQLHIDLNGRFSNGAYIWECPSLIAASRQMGISDMQKTASAALDILFQGKGKANISITPEIIIEAYAEVLTKNDPKLSKELLLTIGKYSFSQTNNRMLRACETTFAAMAEARRGDPVRDQVNACVQSALKNQWEACKENKNLTEITTVEKIKRNFAQFLDTSIHFLYNAAIPLQQVSSDGSSTDGGFELYQRNLLNSSDRGLRIETPYDFRKLTLNVLDLTETTIVNSSDKDSEIIETIMNIRSYMQEDKFLIDAIYAFDKANKKCSDPINQYATLERTPMTCRDGDNPYEVEAIDSGISFMPNIKTITAKNPYALIKWVLDLAIWKEQTQHYLEDNIPNELDPVTSPQHAFNLAIEDEEIVSFIHSKLSSDAWIKQRIIYPGLMIAGSTIDANTKKVFSNAVFSWLADQFSEGLPKNVVQQFEYLTQNLANKKVAVHEYAQTLLDGINHLFGFDSNTTYQISIIMDNLLFKALPDSFSEQLQQSAIRFAKTNWNESVKNIYFCTYFNVRTKAVAFGTIDEDHTNLRAVDEYAWVDNQEWEAVPIVNLESS